MFNILKFFLKLLSQRILKKYQPDVVAISGSVGKTSAKEAVSTLLAEKFSLRASSKNYNNEIGVPLTIIGQQSPGSSIVGWFRVLFKALKLLVFYQSDYPKVLILEMGVDRPGDMNYLVSLAPPKLGIMTELSHSHLEYFGSLQNIKKEKQVLIESVNRKGLSIINYDNLEVRSMANLSQARVLSYGFSKGSDLLATDLHYRFETDALNLVGLNFKINYQGSIVPINMDGIISEAGVYAFLAASLVALHYGLNLMEISILAKKFTSPPGRMRLLKGIKNTSIIDDTYNSSPESSISAIRVLGAMPITDLTKKYAVLGDMLEIGSFTEEGHQLLGNEIVQQKIDYLVSVGERARDIDRAAKAKGMDADKIFHFDKSELAGRFIQNRVKEGDILLVKGSQGMRMEKVVKELMAEPERASELLVRQEANWF
ncbi:MAG: UDP-N-acetylmuramoyl-tripeptide--D-alanyl-D-alanine ligase [Clostridia bacterium]|nr:UDP-N-acetylmuramoyl-tripeptide--D-alanyl-D-alanine ligase [Clostridia bacterium]